jgi:hypothetical protein
LKVQAKLKQQLPRVSLAPPMFIWLKSSAGDESLY